MPYQLRCRCGKVLLVEEGDAGTVGKCECGRPVPVPVLSLLRRMRWAKGGWQATDDTEGRRNLQAGAWWIGGCAVLLVPTWLFAPNQSVAMAVSFWAFVGIAYGLVRLIRGLVQELSDKPPPPR